MTYSSIFLSTGVSSLIGRHTDLDSELDLESASGCLGVGADSLRTGFRAAKQSLLIFINYRIDSSLVLS